MNDLTLKDPMELDPSPGDAAESTAFRRSWAGRAFLYLSTSGPGRYQAAFLALLVVALALRLWELGGRTMHYDEAIHLYYSWRLSNLEGFIHSPWMHGPFQIELVALFLRFLGDTDFAARLAYALFGTALVGLPFFLRDYLGRSGALLTGLMLAMSPSLLYFSRFGRNDIIMAFLALSLFILLWHYIHNPKNRYLFLASGVLAVAFASKETAYIITLIFGALAFLLAIPYSRLWERILGNSREGRQAVEEKAPHEITNEPASEPVAKVGIVASGLSFFKRGFEPLRTNPAVGFLLLLITLSLPQWSAGVELARTIGASLAELAFGERAAKALEEGFGLTLVGRDGITQGIVGAPLWDGPFVALPITEFPVWPPGLFVLLAISLCAAAGWKLSGSWQQRAAAACIPVAIAYSLALYLAKPIGFGIDVPLGISLVVFSIAAFVYLRFSWQLSFVLLLAPALASLVYCLLFLPVLKVDALLINVLPEGIQVASSGNAVPLNFLVAGGILLATGTLSVALGLFWRGGVWLICAVIFYLVWGTLFTTFFTNLAGIFSGAWQGMGYWIAQQEVARGNQPWYYYFVGLSVYELLPVLFGVIGAVVFIRRRDKLGMALAFWAGVNLLAYTVASEKMPWLLVNITMPFALLAGKLLGEQVESIDWPSATSRAGLLPSAALLAIPAAASAGAAYFALAFTNEGSDLSFASWVAIAGSLALALAGALLVRRNGLGHGSAIASLGLGSLLLGFTLATALQATYTYDDSRREILVYAQGSKDLRGSYQELHESLLATNSSANNSTPVQVDYDVWYPFQWYVRHHEDQGRLRFSCFKDEDGENGCRSPTADADASAILLASHNRATEPGALVGYSQSGPLRNLLWFPETYRRPGEDRMTEGPLEEVTNDLVFFGKAVTSREKWNEALGYILNREMDADWFNSEYYTYLRQELTEPNATN